MRTLILYDTPMHYLKPLKLLLNKGAKMNPATAPANYSEDIHAQMSRQYYQLHERYNTLVQAHWAQALSYAAMMPPAAAAHILTQAYTALNPTALGRVAAHTIWAQFVAARECHRALPAHLQDELSQLALGLKPSQGDAQTHSGLHTNAQQSPDAHASPVHPTTVSPQSNDPALAPAPQGSGQTR